ncbi:MAG: hypothetical protein QXF82_05830 [Nitrososphaeria archaeon]
MINLLLFGFKPATGREAYGVGDFFVKRYANKYECIYEYTVLKKIADMYSVNFLVPKVFKINNYSNGAFIIMERIKGTPLKNYVIDYLLFIENKVLKVFNGLRRALKELYHSSLEGLHSGSACQNFR